MLAVAPPVLANAHTQRHVSRLAPSFHRVGPAETLFVSGDYLFTGRPPGRSTGLGVLVDQKTRKSTVVPVPPGERCQAVALGVPWLLAECALETNSGIYSLKLYDVLTHASRTVTSATNIPLGGPGCSGGEDPCATPDAVGADWIGFDVTCYHCVAANVFQNIGSGAVAADPATIGGHTVADLNSPTLGQQVCSPATIPGSYNQGAENDDPGTVIPLGGFVLEAGMNANSQAQAWVQRCGSHTPDLLGTGAYTLRVAADSHMVLWEGSTAIQGVFLPSLRRFTIRVPAGLTLNPDGEMPGDQIALDAKVLYVMAEDGELWSATLPISASPEHLVLGPAPGAS